MNLQDFKKIFTEHGGCVTPDQIEKLAEFAPDLTLGVKVGYGPRFTTTAKNFKLDYDDFNKKIDYVCFQNLKYQAIVYFAPDSWNCSRNSKKIKF